MHIEQVRSGIYVASWNVGTLLEVEGSIETARGFSDVSVVDERKLDQVLSESDRYVWSGGSWAAREQKVWE